MARDTIADAMTNLKNQDNMAKTECILKPSSRLLGEILRVMQENGYIGEYSMVEAKNGNYFKVKLIGKINECKAIKPRHAVKKDEFEKFEKRYLPAYDIGKIIVSTPKGIMTHDEAKQMNVGGRLIAYVY